MRLKAPFSLSKKRTRTIRITRAIERGLLKKNKGPWALSEIKKYSQILMVTHNRRTMEIVDSLYGVTMEKAGVSKMVAVNLNGQNLN